MVASHIYGGLVSQPDPQSLNGCCGKHEQAWLTDFVWHRWLKWLVLSSFLLSSLVYLVATVANDQFCLTWHVPASPPACKWCQSESALPGLLRHTVHTLGKYHTSTQLVILHSEWNFVQIPVFTYGCHSGFKQHVWLMICGRGRSTCLSGRAFQPTPNLQVSLLSSSQQVFYTMNTYLLQLQVIYLIIIISGIYTCNTLKVFFF